MMEERRGGALVGCSLLMLAMTATVASAADAGVEATGDVSNEVEVLRAQVENLVEALAAARSEVDGLRACVTGSEFAKHATVTLKPARIEVDESIPPRLLDVNAELRMAVLDRGERQGIQPGAKFAVLRADRAIAELETVDVRERIAGAVIVNVKPGVFPGTGDRLVKIDGLTK